MLDLISSAGNLILFIVALGFIIFWHELGHFMTAKWTGIKVRRFAVGLGKPAISWRKGVGFRAGSSDDEADKAAAEGRTDLGETEYALCWVPLGGYVAMVGQEDVGADEASEDPRSFGNKPVWQRMIVVSAGVIMNVILAVLLFIGAFMIGVKFPPAEVGLVQHDSPAAQAQPLDPDAQPGLLPGDRIVEVDGERINDFTELKVAIALAPRDQPLEVVVERPAWEGEPARTLRFKVNTRPGPQGLASIGVTQPFAAALPSPGRMSDEEADLIADELSGWPDLELGMTMTAVDGEPIDGNWQYQRAIRQSNGRPLKVAFKGADGEGGAVVVDVEPVTELQVHAPETGADGAATPHMLGLVPPVRINAVVDGSAADGELEAGDLLAGIGEYRWPSMTEVQQAVRGAAGEPLSIAVLRDGEEMRFEIAPAKRGGPFSRKVLGIAFAPAKDLAIAARWIDGQPLAQLDAPRGTRVRAVGGRPVTDLRSLRLAVAEAGPGAVDIAYTVPLLGGDDRTATIELDESALASLNALPWRDPIGIFQTKRELQQASGPGEAIMIGLNKTWVFLENVYMTLAGLARQDIPADALSGPVGITAIGTRMADQGLAYLFWFAGLISVNLAVVNFLPLPIVDGGLFVMLVIEKLRGKPLPAPVQSAISLVGIVLLAAIFLFVTYNDIVRLIGG